MRPTRPAARFRARRAHSSFLWRYRFSDQVTVNFAVEGDCISRSSRSGDIMSTGKNLFLHRIFASCRSIRSMTSYMSFSVPHFRLFAISSSVHDSH